MNRIIFLYYYCYYPTTTLYVIMKNTFKKILYKQRGYSKLSISSNITLKTSITMDSDGHSTCLCCHVLLFPCR